MFEELVRLVHHGYKVELSPQVKRMTINEVRSFYMRYVWRISQNLLVHECGWEGFETPEQCFEDLKNFVNNNNRIKDYYENL